MGLGNEILPYSKIEIDTASDLLEQIDPDYLIASPNWDSGKEGIKFDEHFSPNHTKDRIFFDCTFNSVNFLGTPARNIVLKKCILNNCNIKNSNFKYADFSGSKLNLNGDASSFDFSDFSDMTVYNSNFIGCSFSESYFYNAQIINSRFVHSEFEGSVFQHTYLKDSDLTQVTLDYSEFFQVNLSNVVLPYWSVLHITKGFSEIITSKETKFATPNGTHCVEQAQYIEELKLMIPYFYSTGDYLALVNIYLFEEKAEKAYDAVARGLIESVEYCRFRHMKHLCRMASLAQLFSKSQLHEFYDTIEEQIHKAQVSLSYMEYRNYLRELDSAKHLLIDSPFGKDSMHIVLRTNIPYNDYPKLSIALENINDIFNAYTPDIINHVEVRHNSPLEISIQISDTIINLVTVFVMIEFIFNKSTTYIERIQNIRLGRRELRKQERDNSYIEQLERRLNELEQHIAEQKGFPPKSSLILPGTNEYLQISYILSSTHSIPQELRAYSTHTTKPIL